MYSSFQASSSGSYYFYARGHPNLATPQTVMKEKSPEIRPCSLHFSLLGFSLAMPSLLNIICQEGQYKCMQRHCECVCLHRWGRFECRPMWLHRQGLVPKGKRKPSQEQERGWTLQNASFLQWTPHMTYWTSFISPFISSASTSWVFERGKGEFERGIQK